jgi:DNA-binding GntR family transcriptional regulator
MTAGAAGHEHPIPAQSAHALTVPAEASTGGPQAPVRAASVLADRMAAALVHREPGWRLPRRSALARRYNVSLTEIDAAITDLARRSLVRRLPDGQLYRASPADYWIPIEGAGGLSTRLDPMGGAIACQSRHVSRREAPQDVAWALGLPSGAPIRVIRCVWSAAGDPAAVSTAYLQAATDQDADAEAEPDEQFPSFGAGLTGGAAVAVSVEMSPPQPAVARSLRLSPGQPVTTVTIRFDDSGTGAPGGLTVVMLKPELFRVAIDTAEASVTAPLFLPLRPYHRNAGGSQQRRNRCHGVLDTSSRGAYLAAARSWPSARCSSCWRMWCSRSSRSSSRSSSGWSPRSPGGGCRGWPP